MPDLFNAMPNAQQQCRNGDECNVAGEDARSPYIAEQIRTGHWRKAILSRNVLGLTRDLPIYLAERKTSPVVHGWHGDRLTYCPPLYWDLAIGSGSCGLGCRGCYLLGTFRERRDPYRPVLYDNVAFIWNAARRWLLAPKRSAIHSLGLSTDRSDSLLFEGVFGHARELIPMFADPVRNPHGAKLLLLTKSRNTQYLSGLPTKNVIVSFSLNPEPIADLWEGKSPDTLERITPPIATRLQASLEAQQMGFDVRWRLDPILTPVGWLEHYREFFSQAATAHHAPTRITLGTYRESTPQLHHWRSYWKIPEMEWKPTRLLHDGTHWHIPAAERIMIYKAIAELCAKYFPKSIVSICKETNEVRRATGLLSLACNCLGDMPCVQASSQPESPRLSLQTAMKPS